ncbi:MAG: DsbA family protein [Solirubrobacteraceae bacterium]|nr:DsbA family protein [Solirubrobacteraceae bacterium]
MAAGESVNAHTGDTPPTGPEIAVGADTGADAEPRIDGPAGAPLITVHADLSCPDCAVALDRLSRIEVRIDLRHFVLRSRGEPALRAATAAEAAGLQGAFWPFARGLLRDQGRQDPPHLWALAESLGLDIARFDADRRSEAVKPRIARETRQAITGGAAGIPAVFADRGIADYLARSGYDADVRIRRQDSSAP